MMTTFLASPVSPVWGPTTPSGPGPPHVQRVGTCAPPPGSTEIHSKNFSEKIKIVCKNYEFIPAVAREILAYAQKLELTRGTVKGYGTGKRV